MTLRWRGCCFCRLETVVRTRIGGCFRELDESLKVVDTEPRPRGKTARRWRGTDGSMLLRLVDAVRETRPKRSIPWCLQEMQKRSPGLAKIPLPQLVVRYHEAKKYFRATKQARKQKHPS